MTEQSKIPLPEGKAKSLFERAEDLFGLDGFAAPPVPEGLAEPAAKRPSRKGASAAPASFETSSQPPASIPPEDERAKESELSSNPAHPEERGRSPSVSKDADPSPNSLAQGESAEARAESQAIVFTNPQQRLDRARLAEQGLIQPEGKVTALLEEFRIVKRQLLLASRAARRGGGGASAQRVLVCSPLPGEGKTFCATNLALALAAEKDSEVVLVDADFAKPSVLSTLGLSGGRGLMDALADPTMRVEECVIVTDVPGLYVLPAGNATTSDSEYLASHRTPEVLDRLTQGAPNRMVIFDSPPALAATPAAELAKHIGQALVVARADITGQSALEDALSLLSACPDIKLLLNATHFSPSGRRFGSYYGYGE
jgi:Mrp family chromosome partitioning ATPase